MHIGIVAPEFPPSIGGVQVYSVEVAREYARRGHKVAVFAPRDAATDSFPFEVVPALELRSSLDRKALAAARVDVWHGMNATCAWIEALGRPTVVSAHGNDFLNAYTPFGRLDLRQRWRLPVGSRLDDRVGRWLGQRQLRRHLPRVRRIFVNSDYTGRRLAATLPACRDSIATAGAGVAPSYFDVPLRARPPGRRHLVTAARLDEPRKNIAALIRAVGRLAPAHEVELTIIGEGERRGELEELARASGAAARIRFTGQVAQEEMIRMFAAADLFVLTPTETVTSFEGFGLVYLEANACGTPVLAARTGGVSEAVADGRSGFFVEAPTEQGIERGLARFLAGELRFDSAVCRAHAASHTWLHVVDRMEPFLSAALT
jgi:phosphatidylinositol alpha-1,6-mannosyltransferase